MLKFVLKDFLSYQIDLWSKGIMWLKFDRILLKIHENIAFSSVWRFLWSVMLLQKWDLKNWKSNLFWNEMRQLDPIPQNKFSQNEFHFSQ